jgi:hypothetical protein
LLATTSFDGSIATTFKRTVTLTVCDNTRELALAEAGQQVKVKHSRYSTLKLADARHALQMIHTSAEDFATARPCAWSRCVTQTGSASSPPGSPRSMKLVKR